MACSPFRPVLAVLILAWLGLTACLAQAEVRVALVIGNGGYVSAPVLDNPVNDARDVAGALEELDFKVFLGIDQSHAGMSKLIDDFGEAAAKSDVALFYYAGHAFQVDNQNYLVPVDLTLTDASTVVDQTIALDDVMDALVKSPGLKLVFLDSCRDNPLGLAGGNAPGGLARVGSSADFLIAYATQPGAVAFDGEGRNGTFTEAVLSHIQTAGQDIGDMMIAVRKDVIASTGGQQIPWENSSLTRQFQFDPGPANVSSETILYQVAFRSQDPDLMRLYLERYPDGAHTRDVIAFLSSDKAATDIRTAQRGLEEAGDDGEQLWELAQRTRLRQLYDSYISLYPTGRHVEEARRLAAELPAEQELGPGRRCELYATHPRDRTATTPGVPFEVLSRQVTQALQACQAAVETFPDQARYVALLARATAAAGLRDEAVKLYRQAADAGDLRAMVSLGLLMETGDGVPKDKAGALALYQKAAELGSPDAAINLAVALLQGDGIEQDPERGMALLQEASGNGSAIATFNLGVLAQQGSFGIPSDALALFERAAREGEPRAYRAAAVLLDEGRGVPQDPDAAAVQLLLGIASDDGAILQEFTEKAQNWHRETLRALQARLERAGLYDDALDGVSGPKLIAALQAWRNGGFDAEILANG
ncbi:caspase family protein [Frigidibacter sp. ROC022]|uniref:caspase family protein n=1 Tax=Frigidibacter sp. ROC022 TaxID=2971796 RepID=UPI00215A5EF4|nr:caspase family protein [Frigidibacter sp. ROC022]MCR8725717.1 caspase family protein [Frigidibacter sp. ROC022]